MLSDELKKLVELQAVDTDIFKIRAELESAPVRLKALDDEFAERQNILKEVEEELKGTQLKRKERELDLSTKEGNIKKTQGQMYQVKTNKEYSAMEKEIEGMKADASVIEEAIIGCLDKLDELNSKAADRKKELDIDKAAIDAEKAKINGELNVIKARLEGLESKRAQLAAGVSKDLLVKYEKILHAKNGLAIVGVDGDACQGCNMNLPAQIINEVKMKKDLIFCENCLRILYSYDDKKD